MCVDEDRKNPDSSEERFVCCAGRTEKTQVCRRGLSGPAACVLSREDGRNPSWRVEVSWSSGVCVLSREDEETRVCRVITKNGRTEDLERRVGWKHMLPSRNKVNLTMARHQFNKARKCISVDRIEKNIEISQISNACLDLRFGKLFVNKFMYLL